MILNLIKDYKITSSICEFGGGDSCFYTSFRRIYNNVKYVVFDNSNNGVKAFNLKYKNQFPNNQEAILIDLLKCENFKDKFDFVFSVGLIEHFDKQRTKTMCLKHFEAAKDGGIVLITYPTPTLLYKIIRKISEKLGFWEFHDERALFFEEVDSTCREYGELIDRKLNWVIGLTQEILVYRKSKLNNKGDL